jgi:hypothetical protein
MDEEKDIWEEPPNPSDFFITVEKWDYDKRFDVSAYLNARDAWLEKLKAHYAPIEEKTEPEVYSREFLRQAEAFRALASIIRRSTPPQTAKDLADVLIIEGLADVCEGLAESVMKEGK